jgi:glycosyltransferase involved in cell wall biosynthesis
MEPTGFQRERHLTQRVLILWTNWSGYMDACARQLQELLSCELDIVCLRKKVDSNAPFASEQFFGYPCSWHTLSADTLNYVQNRSYDLILSCGWHVKEYRNLLRSSDRHSIRVLCMDNQWVGSPRQHLGVIAFRAYLRQLYDFAFVPGSRQARFAGYLGFRPQEIIEGHYACAGSFSRVVAEKRARTFLFVGRLVEEKGIGTLAKAWKLYLDRNVTPWRLEICGVGPLSGLLKDLRSTRVLGFVQPSELPDVMRRVSALVLPSLREPWGLVVHEAAQAGLGLVVSDACGAGDYFLRDRLNGRLVPADNSGALCEALEWFHGLDDRSLKRVSECSAQLAAQRTPLSWACSVTRALSLRGLDRTPFRPDR